MSNMLFSASFLSSDHPDLSIELERHQLGELLTLVEQYGHFHLTKSSTGYLLDIAKYKFDIRYVTENNTDLCKISLVDVPRLHPEAADLLAKVARILRKDNTATAILIAGSYDEYKVLWWACRNIDFKFLANNFEQKAWFTIWEQEYQRNPLNQPSVAPIPQGLFNHPGTQAQGETAIELAIDHLGDLLDIVEEYIHFHLSKTPEGYILDVNQYKMDIRFTTDNHVDLCKISLLNLPRLYPGAAELASKVARLLEGDVQSAKDAQTYINARDPDELKVLWSAMKQAEFTHLTSRSAALKTHLVAWDEDLTLNRSRRATNLLVNAQKTDYLNNPSDPQVNKP